MKCLHFSHMTPISLNGRKPSWWRKGTIPECVNNTGQWSGWGPSAMPASAMSLRVGLPKSDPAQDALGWTIRVFWEFSTQRGLLWPTDALQFQAGWDLPCLLGNPRIADWTPSHYIVSPRSGGSCVTLELEIGLSKKLCFCVGCSQRPGAGRRLGLNLAVRSSPLPHPVQLSASLSLWLKWSGHLWRWEGLKDRSRWGGVCVPLSGSVLHLQFPLAEGFWSISLRSLHISFPQHKSSCFSSATQAGGLAQSRDRSGPLRLGAGAPHRELL